MPLLLLSYGIVALWTQTFNGLMVGSFWDIYNKKALFSEKGQYGAAVSDFIDHLDYMVNLIGINHVGISSDFDGGGGVHG